MSDIEKDVKIKIELHNSEYGDEILEDEKYESYSISESNAEICKELANMLKDASDRVLSDVSTSEDNYEKVKKLGQSESIYLESESPIGVVRVGIPHLGIFFIDNSEGLTNVLKDYLNNYLNNFNSELCIINDDNKIDPSVYDTIIKRMNLVLDGDNAQAINTNGDIPFISTYSYTKQTITTSEGDIIVHTPHYNLNIQVNAFRKLGAIIDGSDNDDILAAQISMAKRKEDMKLANKDNKKFAVVPHGVIKTDEEAKNDFADYNERVSSDGTYSMYADTDKIAAKFLKVLEENRIRREYMENREKYLLYMGNTELQYYENILKSNKIIAKILLKLSKFAYKYLF